MNARIPAFDSSVYVFLFFFSSRRRHTRYWRDWSSDVCSSDLEAQAKLLSEEPVRGPLALAVEAGRHRAEARLLERDFGRRRRSEERRVGKECRSRWSPYH